jgi:predicted nucleic acid-binding protein
MILYVDMSALVKNYIKEDHSTLVKESIKAAEIVASHDIAYVGIISAFSRMLREGWLSEKSHKEAKRKFLLDWESISKIENTPELIARAGDAAENFGLRANDCLHLVAAEYLLNNTRDEAIFGCFDEKLNKGAHFLRLQCFQY